MLTSIHLAVLESKEGSFEGEVVCRGMRSQSVGCAVALTLLCGYAFEGSMAVVEKTSNLESSRESNTFKNFILDLWQIDVKFRYERHKRHHPGTHKIQR